MHKYYVKMTRHHICSTSHADSRSHCQCTPGLQLLSVIENHSLSVSLWIPFSFPNCFPSSFIRRSRRLTHFFLGLHPCIPWPLPPWIQRPPLPPGLFYHPSSSLFHPFPFQNFHPPYYLYIIPLHVFQHCCKERLILHLNSAPDLPSSTGPSSSLLVWSLYPVWSMVYKLGRLCL